MRLLPLGLLPLGLPSAVRRVRSATATAPHSSSPQPLPAAVGVADPGGEEAAARIHDGGGSAAAAAPHTDQDHEPNDFDEKLH